VKVVAWVDVLGCGSDRVVGRPTRRAPCGLAQWCHRPARGRDVCVRLMCAAVRDGWRSAMRGWGARLQNSRFTPCRTTVQEPVRRRGGACSGVRAGWYRRDLLGGGGWRACGGGGRGVHSTFLINYYLLIYCESIAQCYAGATWARPLDSHWAWNGCARGGKIE
jgi:hypothetical protein